MSDVITELAMEANDKAMEIARLKAENSELQNDADLLRAMLSQERLEKQCYMAENAELQETLQRRTEQFEGMTNMWAKRGVENFKLRELVRDLWEACPADGYYCIYHCKHYDKESESHCKLEDRMRELEVDE